MTDSLKDRTCIYTVCSICYLPKALALSESVFSIEKKKVIIYLADRKTNIAISNDFAEIRWIEDENIPNLNQLAFIYDVTELSTCIKPLLTRRLLESNKAVIFLDPDICIYSSLDAIYSYLAEFPIILTPHYITPHSTLEEGFDQGMMRHGSFNLGFFAVNDSAEAKRYLDWWNARCISLGFFETQFGLTFDQKWISIAPCFFPGLKILFDKGYNMAYWNLHERNLTERNGQYWVNGESRLVFFHFSSFDAHNPRIVSTRLHDWNATGRDDLSKICLNYAERLKKNDNSYSGIKYGFDYFNNGSYISPTLRRAYACMRSKLFIEDPFAYSGRMRKFVEKNFLREKSGEVYKASGKSDIGDNSMKFKIAYFFMRRILQIIGPNQFTNFSRLLVFLSSYRQNEGQWKL
jgi:hypothetical protein